jgi:1,4-alpha-glucan branching enzyme
MATKKQSTPKVVAEKPTKAVKAAPVAETKVDKAAKAIKSTPVTESKATPVAKAVKAAAPKAAAKTTTPAEKTSAPKAAAVKTATPVAKSAKVTFTLPKEAVENAETVAVFGDFNNWQNGVVLTKQKDGSFKTAVELEKGRSYEYRFLINGEKWENDWAAQAYVPTPFGTYNSVVTA